MPEYRLYRLDPHNGHITGAQTFHASDDVEAVCLVHQRVLDVPMELWRGAVKLAHYDAEPEMAGHPPPMKMQERPGV